MPTTITWTGVQSIDPTVAANYNPAQVPVTGDTLIFDGAVSQRDMGGGDLSAVALAAFIERETYNGRVGTPATPLKIDAVNFDIFGSSGSYIENPNGSNGVWRIKPADETAEIVITGNASATPTAQFAIYAGYVTIGSSVGNIALIQIDGTYAHFGPAVSIGASSYGVVWMSVRGPNAFVLSGRRIGSALGGTTQGFFSMQSGVYRQFDGGCPTVGGANPNIHINGGSFVWASNDDNSGLIWCRGGVADFRESTGATIPNIYWFDGGDVLYDSNSATITVTDFRSTAP